MASNFSGRQAAVVLDDDRDLLRFAICPLCQVSATLTLSTVQAGGAWRCTRCGQHWDAARLSAVAAYAAWTLDRDRVRRCGTEGSVDVPFGDSSPERVGGRL